MVLEEYIKELLYRYDCVIVPEFGAFISNTKPAIVNEGNFSPPHKKITFNSLIQNNDGLLANHIAQSDKMPYETAINFIKFETESWVDTLLDDELVLDGIGYLYLVDEKIHFESNDNTNNYLTSSFGLSSFVSNEITRTNTIKTILDANNNRIIVKTSEAHEITPYLFEETEAVKRKVKSKKETTSWFKYAAILLIGASIISMIGKKMYDDRLEMEQILVLQKQQEIIENKIQTATFIITSPLPTITINTERKIESIKKYHIISGAFRSPENAQKSVNELNQLGYEASIVGVNKWELTQVACQSYYSLEEANKALRNIKRKLAKDAWVFIMS